MRLTASQLCPIHRSKNCCGRTAKAQQPRKHKISGPVTRIPVDYHPRGYIEVCSPAELRHRLSRKLREQKAICGLCDEPITECYDATLDHKQPRPAGCRKDDHIENLQAVHARCNLEKGSQRNYQPKKEAQ